MIASLAIRRAWPPGIVPQMTAMRDGWRVRNFDYPAANAPPRGSILCQGGRGDFLEKYLESFAHWHDRGWHVSGFDWRGQGGSGRLLDDPQIGHVRDFTDWIEDLAEFYTEWHARTPGPHIVIGHSMGGHLVLRALIERRIAPDALVLVSPMLGFDTGPLPVAVSAGLVRLAARLGRAEKPAWKANERPASSKISRQFFLTHDADRYADELWWREQNPELALGPPSINWLLQAHASNQRISATGALEGVETPVLILGTDADRLVSPRAIRAVAARIPRARLHMFGKEAAHEILREADPVRDATLAAIDSFLDEKAAQG
jgi:lysophospholipase